MFYPSESDDPENEATSFIYEKSPSGELGPRHTNTTIITHQQVSVFIIGLNNCIQAAHVPEVFSKDGNKKSSSSSEEGFVKIYSDLGEFCVDYFNLYF
jgi:hypothetical protein